MRTEKFNKPFEKDQVLSHTELNNITDAVDDVIDVLSSLSEGSSTLTDALIESKIQNKIHDSVEELNGVVELLSENLEGTAAELVKAKNAIGIIVQSDEHGDSIKRAAIVAAINEDGSSIAGIQADKIVLDGNVTASGTLTTLDAEIANIHAAKADVTSLLALEATVNNINIPDTATIKQAVIDDLTTGDLTITGTLHYNKMLGNVVEVPSGLLQDDAYFVQFTGSSTADPSQYPVITLPTNPTLGLTIFISVGTKCFKLKSTNNTIVYYTKHNNGGDLYTILEVNLQSGNTLNVFDAGWNGVVEFIYTGTKWQLLIHNIILANV